jgi:hypothetical protein
MQDLTPPTFRWAARMTLAAVACASMALGACAAPGADDDASTGALAKRQPKVTDTDFATAMSSARAMQPYNSIVDSTLAGAPCVGTVDGNAPIADRAVAGSEVSLQQIASRTALASDIGLDATLKAGVAPGPNVTAGMHLLAHYDTSKGTLSFLLKSTKTLRESYPAEYQLTTGAQVLLRSDPLRFAKQCGRGFITGLTHSATLYALVQVHVESEEVAAAAATTIGGEAKVGVVGDITASVASRIAALRDKLGLKVTVDVLMDGFSTTLSVPTLDMSQLTPVTTAPATADPGPADPNVAKLPALPTGAASTDKALATFSQQLKEMLDAAQAVQQDVIDGKRNSAPRLSEVSVVPYRTLATAAEDDVRFDAVDAALIGADKYLKSVAKVRQQLANVVELELDPFLRATEAASSGAGGVAYNRRVLTSDGTIDGSKFLTDPDAMRRIAASWREDFASDAEGTTRGDVETLLDDCFRSAQNGDYRACSTESGGTVLAHASAALAKYAAEGRILPVLFASSAPVTYGERGTQCGEGWHVVSGKTEVVALSLVLPSNTQNGAPKLATWVDEPPVDCADQAPLYAVAGATGSFSCRAESRFGLEAAWKLPVLCVPRGGVFGLVSEVPGETADKF